jgi:hypothetical protein
MDELYLEKLPIVQIIYKYNGVLNIMYKCQAAITLVSLVCDCFIAFCAHCFSTFICEHISVGIKAFN